VDTTFAAVDHFITLFRGRREFTKAELRIWPITDNSYDEKLKNCNFFPARDSDTKEYNNNFCEFTQKYVQYVAV
jgi:hypothetical protein